MLHHQCTDILCPWINNDDKKKKLNMYKLHSFVNVSYLSIATLIILKHPFCFWLTVFTVFAKVMQTIYCIFSSRDLSSKIWEKIWSKVRGLFKQYNYGKNIGWFCVKYSSWSENQWMKGPYQSIVHSNQKPGILSNFVDRCSH